MNINVNLDKKPKTVSLTDFVILSAIYNSPDNRLLIKKFINYFAGLTVDSLADEGYIKINSDSLSLRQTGLLIFEDEQDVLFSKFIETFPTRIPNGRGGSRAVSPSTTDTIQGALVRKKWNTITKGNTTLQKHIIRCLEAEIDNRTKHNELQFFRNIETWLNKGTYEESEHLLETSITKSGNTYETTI